MDISSLLCGLFLFFLNFEHVKSEAISPEDYPFHAIFLGTDLCVGALISEKYVLTLASCLTGFTEVNVTLGSKNNPKFASVANETDVQIILSSEIVIHKEYYHVAKYLDVNDIALIKLSSSAVLSKTVQPVKFAPSDVVDTLYSKTVDASGWKSTKPDPLLLEKVTLLNFDTCTYVFGNQLFSQNLCVSSNDVITPLAYGDIISYKGQIFGLRVVSPDVIKNFNDSYYKLCVNVNFFLNWISSQTNISITDLVASKTDSASPTTSAPALSCDAAIRNFIPKPVLTCVLAGRVSILKNIKNSFLSKYG